MVSTGCQGAQVVRAQEMTTAERKALLVSTRRQINLDFLSLEGPHSVWVLVCVCEECEECLDVGRLLVLWSLEMLGLFRGN